MIVVDTKSGAPVIRRFVARQTVLWRLIDALLDSYIKSGLSGRRLQVRLQDHAREI